MKRWVYGVPLLYMFLSLLPSCASTPPDNGANIKREYNIIDSHEHIYSMEEAYKLIQAMREQNVIRTVLVGSPKELFYNTGDESGFTDSEWNNNEILQISKRHPEVFYAFATFRPDDPRILEKLKAFLQNGGKGLKLYNGHINFHDKFHTRLDAPHLMEVYEYCEKNRIPIIFHANARLYWPELKNVLDKYPNLVVNLPHFCMSLIDLNRMEEIFNNYPNVYTDVSLGHYRFAYPALQYVSDRWQTYRDFILKYRSRFLFATDMVFSPHTGYDVEYASLMISGYRDFLEKRRYTNILIDEYLMSINQLKTKDNGYFNGLELDVVTLRYIYEENPKRFLGQ